MKPASFATRKRPICASAVAWKERDRVAFVVIEECREALCRQRLAESIVSVPIGSKLIIPNDGSACLVDNFQRPAWTIIEPIDFDPQAIAFPCERTGQARIDDLRITLAHSGTVTPMRPARREKSAPASSKASFIFVIDSSAMVSPSSNRAQVILLTAAAFAQS